MIRGTHTQARPEAMTAEEFDAALMHGLATPGPLGLALVSALLDLPVKDEVTEAPSDFDTSKLPESTRCTLWCWKSDTCPHR